MEPRIDYARTTPQALAAMRALEAYVRGSSLEPELLELVRIRASQINGCAFCLDMHTKDARALGETEQRLYALSAWRETPFYNMRERAALAWCEALTRLPDDPVSDAHYEEVQRQFKQSEIVDLTMAIVAINGWNRLGVALRTVPGTYQRPGA